MECSHDYFIDNDHSFSPDLPQEETITEAYKESYDKILVCEGTSPCSPHVDEGLENLLPCNIFETKSFEEDCYEHEEDMDSRENGDMDEYSLTSDMDGYDDYWKFIGNLIYNMSREGSVYSESFGGFIENPICDMSIEGIFHLGTWGGLSVEKEHAKFSYNHLEPYHLKTHTSISNEYFERKCIKESNLIQPMEGHPEPAFSG